MPDSRYDFKRNCRVGYQGDYAALFSKSQSYSACKTEISFQRGLKIDSNHVAWVFHTIYFCIKNELKQKKIKIIFVKGLPMVENWRLICLKQKKVTDCKKTLEFYSKK